MKITNTCPCYGSEECYNCCSTIDCTTEIEVINCTPHDITIMNSKKIVIEASGIVARVSTTMSPSGMIGDIPLSENKFGEVENLPEPKKGTRYLVSRMVMEACPKRHDLLVPGECVRDEEGKIIGCKSLSIN